MNPFAAIKTLFLSFLMMAGAVVILPSSVWAAIPSPIVLAIGRSKTIPAPGSGDIRITKGKIITLVDQGRRLRLTGQKTGQTQLSIGNLTYDILVLPRAQYQTWQSLETILRRQMGPKLEWSNSQVTVTGRLHRIRDWENLIAANHGPFVFSAIVDPDLETSFANSLKNRLRRLGLPPPRIRFTPQIHVEFPALTDAQKISAKSTMEKWGLEWSTDSAAWMSRALVEIQVTMAEVSRSFSRQLGVRWPSSYQAQLAPRWEAAQQLMIELEAMETSGQGQILAQPKLVTRSGSKAEFLAGGEIPIQVRGYFAKNAVTWKRHGIWLEVTPEVNQQKQISLDIRTEISQLDPQTTIDGIPGLKTSRVSTHFDLPTPQTVVLSGLLRADSGSNRSGLPALSRLPILGPLFSSENFLENRSELIIFMTPKISTPEDLKPELPREWKRDSF